MKKTITTLLLSMAILGGTSLGSESVSAAEIDTNSGSEEHTIMPYINWNGATYLTTGNYSNVATSNNLFPDSPTVTNGTGNPGTITVRVVGSNGAQIGKTKTIKAGKSVQLDRIPALSGTYTIQAKASKAGTYNISVD